jgi:hypothetical protein
MNEVSFSSVGTPLGEAFHENEVPIRTFDQLITERGNLFSNQLFNNIYNSIRDKLFTLNDNSETALPSEKVEEYNAKWNIKNLNESIETFKKDLGDLYQRKNHIEIELNKKKEKYKSFCDHVSSLLESMEPFYAGSPEQDQFRKILKERIEWYYSELNLARLALENKIVNEEFSFMKETLKNISSISNSTQCSICYENQVSWYIDPCGHTLCGSCKERCSENTMCHYCSTKKNKYSRLYL